MDSEKLTVVDIDILMDAMKCWEERHILGETVGGLMVAMLAKDEKQRSEIMAEENKRKSDSEHKRRLDKERSIVIQAKLIALKDSIRVEEIT